MKHNSHQSYLVCIRNAGKDDMDLIPRRLYRVAAPDPNDHEDEVRIIDESGEDYLYPRSWFMAVDLPQSLVQALEAA